MSPFRAMCGALDNRHDVLEWDGPGELPQRLLALTDKPQGRLGPTERWWPSVGCGPVDAWWCLWWTMPDREATRAGMVRSAVAVWPRARISRVDDLRPALEALAGEALGDVEDPWLAGLAHRLLEDGEPPVVADLDRWPRLLAGLWPRLWPEARSRFSARVMLGPAQGLAAEHIRVLATPSSLMPRWPIGRRVEAADPSAVPRAARWLMGAPDETLDRLLADGLRLGNDPADLRRAARAADRLDALTERPGFDRALAAVRTLSSAASRADVLADAKATAVKTLAEAMADASAESLLRLRNVGLDALPSSEALVSAFEDRVERLCPALDAPTIDRLLGEADGQAALPWWRQSMWGAVQPGLTRPDPQWSAAILRWLGQGARRVDAALGAEASIEARLVDALTDELARPALLPPLVRRRWSRLHAEVALRVLTPRAALMAQMTLGAHVDRVVDAVPGPDAVHAALDAPTLVDAVARRTAREPALLSTLRAASSAWRGLWAAHIRAGGTPWPPGVDAEQAGPALLDAVVGGDMPSELTATLDRLGEIALDHPRRAALWPGLDAESRRVLLGTAAAELVERCKASMHPQPEAPLARAVVQRVRALELESWSQPAQPYLVATLLSWDIPLDEATATRWLKSGRNDAWAPVVEQVGQALLKRRWRAAAKDLYFGWSWDRATRPALLTCRTLFKGWRRASLDALHHRSPESQAALSKSLAQQVAQIGARLMPGGDQLAALWHRIGGQQEHLPTSKTPAMRWEEAARLAVNGAIGGGLVALVAGLLDDFPHNAELKELKRALKVQA